MKTFIKSHFPRVGQLYTEKKWLPKVENSMRIFFSNDLRMCSDSSGFALSVTKHLGTVLTSLDSIWDNLKKIEKMKFFASKFSKFMTVRSFASGNFLTGCKIF